MGTFTKIHRETPNLIQTEQNYRNFYVHTRYFHIVKSTTKYSVALWHCERYHLFPFCGNTEPFYIVDCYMYANWNINLFLRFHDDNGYANASQCLVRHTLPILFLSFNRWPHGIKPICFLPRRMFQTNKRIHLLLGMNTHAVKISLGFLFLPCRNSPQWAKASSLSRIHDHTQTQQSR
jgi:hypothetical protein